MKKYIIIFLAALSISASAQVISNKDPNEFSINLGGGLSSINYQLAPDVNYLNGYTFDLGIGYTFYIHDNWGIYTGITQSLYKAKRVTDLKVFTPGLTDKNGTVSAIVINSVDWGGNNYTAETTFTYSVSGTTITIKFSITEWNNTGLPVRYTMYEIGRLSNEAVSNPTGFSNVETLTFTKSGENLTGTNCTFTYKPNK